jgi:hypothetical protein
MDVNSGAKAELDDIERRLRDAKELALSSHKESLVGNLKLIFDMGAEALGKTLNSTKSMYEVLGEGSDAYKNKQKERNLFAVFMITKLETLLF